MSKIQFNQKSAKAFLNDLSKYYNANHQLNDFICSHSDRVANYKGLVDSNTDMILKWDDPTCDDKPIRTRADLVSELTGFMEKLDTLKLELASAQEVAKTRRENAEKRVSKELYEAYKSYVSIDFECVTDYSSAMASWLVAQGLSSACDENVDMFTRISGVRNLRGKSACKAESSIACESFAKFRTTLLNFISEQCVKAGIIDQYKYDYKIEQKNK